MKYCLKCGNIVSDNSMFKDDIDCCNCKIPFENDNITSKQFESFTDKEKEEYIQKLYNLIKESDIFQEELSDYGTPMFYSAFWFEKYESLTNYVAARTGDDLRQHMQAKYGKNSPAYQKAVAQKYIDKARAEKQESNLVKCPYCQSTNTSKITLTKRAVKVGLFGIFGAIDDAGKTYKCNGCGCKF